MIEQDRRLRGGERPNRAIFLVWLGLCVLLCLIGLQNILGGSYPDPDDSLRLVQVRDLIAGQGWYDLHQYRITPPEGVLMHWSRLVDIPLLLAISALKPLLGQASAELVASVAIPLLVLLGILIAVGRLAWRLFDTEIAIFACLAIGFWPAVVFQVQPMRIDHHSWQMLAVALSLWGISWRAPRKGAVLAGLAMAAGLSISLEILPMAAAFGAVLMLRWLSDFRERWWLVSYLQALALGLVTIFAATRGLPDLATHCDAISPVHVGAFVILAIGATMIAVLPRLSPFGTLMLLALSGGAGAALIVLAAPQCLGSPFAGLDPIVRAVWYDNVLEGKPVWRQPLEQGIPALAQGLVALAATVALIGRSSDWLRRWWTEYAILLAAAIIAGCLTFRSMSFAGIVGAIPMGWLAWQMFRILRTADKLWVKIASVAAIYIILVPNSAVIFVSAAMPRDQLPQSMSVRRSSCDFPENAPLLNTLPRATLFTAFDIGPSILLKSHHSVVATGHHRANDAMRDVIEAFRGPPGEARKTIERYGADYVVVCTDLSESRKLAALGGKGGFMDRLVNGDAPDWLEPVDIGTPEALKVWRVLPDNRPAATPPGNPSPRR